MFTITKAQGLIAITAIGFAAAMPAHAKPAPEGQSMRMTIEQKAGKTVYCMVQQAQTGSIINAKVCRTRAEWAEKGLNIPEQQRAAETGKDHPAS